MYQKAFFKHGTAKEEMLKQIKHEGFNPLLISDEHGYLYQEHQHAETKLLVCVTGSMQVTVEDTTYDFEPGDKLIIPGESRHSAVVGKDGCTFYWAEKL